MAVPAHGLNEGDPRQLGGYRLVGRLGSSSLGTVFLGRDGSGDEVSLAVLNGGAGADAHSRKLFVDAISESDDVVAARTHGRSALLWVAVPFREEGPGAEDFLERAGRPGRAASQGPMVLPHWAGERVSSAVRWSPWAGRRDSSVTAAEGNWWLIGALGVVMLLILLLATLLYWWMLQFPSPEIPMVQPEFEPSETEQEGEPSPDEQEEEEEEESGDSTDEPTPVPAPTPEEGEGELGEEPEDNL